MLVEVGRDYVGSSGCDGSASGLGLSGVEVLSLAIFIIQSPCVESSCEPESSFGGKVLQGMMA